MTATDTAKPNVDQTGMPLDALARSYHALGVTIVRDFFSPHAIAIVSDEADRLLEKYQGGLIEERRIALRPTADGGRTFERLDPVCDIAPACAALSRDPRLIALASALIGGEPYLFKDKLIYKFPGDRGYSLHQDYPYYNLNEALKDKVVTIAVAIDEVSDETGGLNFFLGRHDRVQKAPPSDPRDCDPAALADAPLWSARLSPGSVVAFHTLTPHRSGTNETKHPRRMLYLTYIDKNSSWLRDEYYEVRIADRIATPS